MPFPQCLAFENPRLFCYHQHCCSGNNTAATLFVNINYAFKWILKCSRMPGRPSLPPTQPPKHHSQQHHKNHRLTPTTQTESCGGGGKREEPRQLIKHCWRKIGNCTKVLTWRRILNRLTTGHRTLAGLLDTSINASRFNRHLNCTKRVHWQKI